MGRAFEFRRARKEKRWGKMAVAFTKLSKEITLADFNHRGLSKRISEVISYIWEPYY